jgi:signal transduction histidine kinase
MLIAVLALLVLAIAVVALVAWPLVRERTAEPSSPDAHRLALLERRDAALQALQELDLDHQAGKLTDEDAEGERQTLRDEAVAVLAELEEQDGGAASGGARDRADLA